ncbi:cytochrome P450 [Streptomyces sp. NPDC059355]|uniref:cytochrome P450 n=1 Tax=Streptomyces sp. NPDC059355 TaxID=3346811 RepID=UPI0036C2BF47
MTPSPATWTVATAPGRLPLIGHALKLRKGLLAFVSSLPAHGDLVRIQIGPWWAYVICDPDLTRQVLFDDRTFDKGGPLFDEGRRILGNGVLTCPHEDHRRQRRLLQPAFHRARMPAYAQVMSEQTAELLDGWHGGTVIDVPAHMHTLVSRILARSLFASDSVGPASTLVEESLATILHAMYVRLLMPSSLTRLPTPGNRRYQQALDRIHTAVDHAVQDYRSSGEEHADLVSELLAARDEAGRPLSDTEIHDQILTMLAAGIETTATTLSWALYMLARHPDVEERLHAEVDTVLGGRTATWADLPRLGLTERIITETLRLYPPTWMLTRTVTADTRLGGQLLPAGATVVYSPYLIHTRADLFHEPGRFHPDRWRADNTARPPRHASIPFGAGSRKCIGDSFAMTAATLSLAGIASRWRLALPSGRHVRPAATAALRPHKLRMRATRRGPAV